MNFMNINDKSLCKYQKFKNILKYPRFMENRRCDKHVYYNVNWALEKWMVLLHISIFQIKINYFSPWWYQALGRWKIQQKLKYSNKWTEISSVR